MAGHVIKNHSSKAKALALFSYHSVPQANVEKSNGVVWADDVRSLFTASAAVVTIDGQARQTAFVEPAECAPHEPALSQPHEADSPNTEPAEIDPHEIQKRAFAEGLANGEKAGREVGERQMDALYKRLAETVLEIGQLRNKLYHEVEREVLQLALAIAKKVVRREVNMDPDVTLALVRVAMSHIAEKTTMKVRLNPIDHDGLLLHAESLQLGKESAGVILQSDSSIDRGGCYVETEYGNVDARIEEQFKEIESGLLEMAPG
ncbi:MAG: hypothetical protein HYR55_15975 [Acidobacteria bacterium]|nr:hypothetical protein [Acidobacteriota bacterium]MBI3657838.1 hypothetical protein [Acidobacteriota bacterium]